MIVMKTLDLNQGVFQLMTDQVLDNDLSVNCSRINIFSFSHNFENALPFSNPPSYPSNSAVSCSVGPLINMLSSETDMLFVYFDSSTGITASGQEVTPDMTGNQVENIIPDSTRPLVVSIELDLNTGQLISTFDEEIVSQDPLHSTILSFLWHQADGSNVMYILTGGSILEMNFGDVVTMYFSSFDLNSIKCTTAHTPNAESNTFLKIPAGFVSDTSGNAIAEAILPVEEIVVDRTLPNLLEFELDLNTGIIVLKFDESLTYQH